MIRKPFYDFGLKQLVKRVGKNLKTADIKIITNKKEKWGMKELVEDNTEVDEVATKNYQEGYEQGLNARIEKIRNDVLALIKDRKDKGYEAETILESVKNNLKFNKFE